MPFMLSVSIKLKQNNSPLICSTWWKTPNDHIWPQMPEVNQFVRNSDWFTSYHHGHANTAGCVLAKLRTGILPDIFILISVMMGSIENRILSIQDLLTNMKLFRQEYGEKTIAHPWDWSRLVAEGGTTGGGVPAFRSIHWVVPKLGLLNWSDPTPLSGT